MSTQIAHSDDDKTIAKLYTQIEQRSAEFKMVLPSHITPEKFQRTIVTAAQTNPGLLKCDRQSLVTACMKAAQDGLLPDGREAALVPFKQRYKGDDGQWYSRDLVQYISMTSGVRKKILQSGEVRDVFASVVYRQEIDAGLFIYEEGSARMLRHKPLLDVAFDPKDEDIVAAYSVATFADGTQSFEVMRRSEINKIRQTSQTGALGREYQFGKNKGQTIAPSGPWVEWFSEMCKKSVVKRHSKLLPMSGDIQDDDGYGSFDASQSARGVLEAVADAPVPMPMRETPEAIADQSGERVDPDTGEITSVDDDPKRGASGKAQKKPTNVTSKDHPSDRTTATESPGSAAAGNVDDGAAEEAADTAQGPDTEAGLSAADTALRIEDALKATSGDFDLWQVWQAEKPELLRLQASEPALYAAVVKTKDALRDGFSKTKDELEY